MSKPAKITILTICIVIVGFFSIAKFLFIVIIVPDYIIETVKEEQEIMTELVSKVIAQICLQNRPWLRI